MQSKLQSQLLQVQDNDNLRSVGLFTVYLQFNYGLFTVYLRVIYGLFRFIYGLFTVYLGLYTVYLGFT